MTEWQQRGGLLSTTASSAARPTRGQFTANINAIIPLCRDHYRLVLGLPWFPPASPGQFVQLACRRLDVDYSPEREFEWEPGRKLDLGGRELMSPLAYLRRPFSLAGRRDVSGGVELNLILRVVGTGTDWLANLKTGESVQLIGPLGNSFDPPAADQAAILVGGGVGIPPMIYLARELAGRRAVVFAGALTRDLLPLTVTADAPEPSSDSFTPLYNIAEFAQHGIPAVISTNDGTYGYRGLVTHTLEHYLDQYFGPPSGGNGARRDVVIYTCGPEPMMKAVAQIANQRGIECQVSVERAMACGMGTCQSCVIRVKKPDPAKPPLAGRDWCYRLACTDGPIFKGADLLW